MNLTNLTIKSFFSGSANKWLVGILFGMFVMYSFFIARTVVAINERKMLYSSLREEQIKVADLETHYFNLASQLDISKATLLGFNNSETPRFAYTQKSGQDTVALAQ